MSARGEMPDSCTLLDDDDDAASLMPRVAKLIRVDHSSSLESNGSTSMSLSGTSRRVRAEVVLRDVANRFLRKGAAGERSILGACERPDAFDTLRTYSRRNVLVSEKENLRPKASTMTKQDALPVAQRKSAMRDISKKAAREPRKNRSVVKLGQRRTVNSKIQGAVKYNSACIIRPEHLATHAATVNLPTASQSTHGSEGSCYVSSLAAKNRRGKVKLFTKTTPLSFSELQQEFAQLDKEALEEEEVSIGHLAASRPVLAPKIDDIVENVEVNRENLSRNVNGREDEIGTALNPSVEKDPNPNYSHGQRQERTDSGVALSKAFISCRNSKRSSQFSSPVAAQQQFNVKLQRRSIALELRQQQNVRVDQVDIEAKEGLSVCPTLPKPLPHCGVVSQNADGDERGNVKCRDGGNRPDFEEDPESPSVNRMEDIARTADTKISAIPFDVSAQEFSTKGTSVCAVLRESETAESSCNNMRGHSPSKPNEEILKETTVDGPDGNACNREDVVLGHKSTFRGDFQGAPFKSKRPLKQKGVSSDVHLQEGTHSTRGTSATPRRDPLKLACRIPCNRTRRCTDMSQRRLVFDSSSESLSRQKVVARNTHDVSVSSVEFKSEINPTIDVLIPDIHEDDVNMTSIPLQDGIKLQVTNHDEVTSPVDDCRGCTSESSKSKAAARCEDLVAKETPLSGSREQDQNNPPVADVTSPHVTDGCALNQKTQVMGSLADDSLPAVEASKEVVGSDPGIDPLGPQAGPSTEVTKTRKLCKRASSNLGDPIDGGSEWKKGRRVSTRIKSRPLDWWRGERMLYGRVHRTLCTLIGIKTTSPDPAWPRPKPRRGDYNERNFHVDSFVGDSHGDLLRLAAQ